MQKSNWREEIELNEFVGPLINTATRIGATVDAINKVRKNPLVQKGFKSIKNKATDLLTPKSFKKIDKPEVKVEPEVDKVNTEKKPIKGFTPTKFKPKGFTPDKKEIDKLRPKKIDTNPVENPNKEKETETNPQPEKEKGDNKKKITTITKIRDNNIDKNKQKNNQKINNKDSQKNKNKVRVPLVTKTPTNTKNKTTRRVPPVGLPKILPVPIPIGRRKAASTPRREIERLAATRDRDGDGKLERKRKSGEYQETYNYSKTMNSTTAKPKPTTKPSLSQKMKRLAATRDRDGDGKIERKRKSGEFQEALLYDIVHDYIIAENFASDTEGANKVMLKLSDELMQEIYERTMTASEKRKDTMLKKKYDDSDMKKNMQAQYGKEEGKKVYFATIRKQAMKKEEVVNEVSSKTLRNYIIKGTKDVAKRASDPDSDSGPKYGKKMSRIDGVSKAADKLAKKASSDTRMKEEVEQEDPSVKAKMKRQAMIKKQVLMKKLQAVRAVQVLISHLLINQKVK